MKHFAVSLIFAIFFSGILTGQNPQEKGPAVTISPKLFYSLNFSSTIPFYKKQLLFDPDNSDLYYSIGFAFLNTKGMQDSALVYLRQAYNKLGKSNRPTFTHPVTVKYYLAYAYVLNGNLDSAVVLLNSIELPEETQSTKFAIRQLWRKIDSVAATKYEIYHLTAPVNSKFIEHSPIFIPEQNKLMFTSTRKLDENSYMYEDGQYDENIYYTIKNGDVWSKPQPLKGVDNSNNQATCSYNDKNGIFIFYRDEQNGALYWAKNINGKISTPSKFPKPINTLYPEMHASITDDGRTLYFAAERPDGFGGTDIYVSHMKDNGSWSKPVNLGPGINTEEDETAPFISHDGKTLYFSSRGRNTLGGYDVFVAHKTQFGTWPPAENLGYPVNTEKDDIFFFPVDSVTAFIASSRKGSLGHTDIFIIKRKMHSPQEEFLFINIWKIKNYDKEHPVTVYILQEHTNQRAIARPNKRGKFVFVTKPSKPYVLTIEDSKGNVLYEEKFTAPKYENEKTKKKLEKTITLQPAN